VVFVNPLLSMFQHAVTPKPYEFWMAYDFELIKLLARSGPGVLFRSRKYMPSSGADKEVALAESLSVPVVTRIDPYLDQWFKPAVNPHIREVDE
jgi:hypothetical protein